MTDGLPQSGMLLVDKKEDWTSHDVVNFVRRFGFRKVGHCGTLDPAATGLLVLVLGKATKLSMKLSGQDKEYIGTLTLGKETDSHDATGNVVKEADWDHIEDERIQSVFSEFLGEQDQIPPMVSALKKGGKKLYELARKGIEVEREPRRITIFELEILSISLPEVTFRVKCSKGTYIRSLCSDMANAMQTVGHLSSLRRTRSGKFSVDNAVTMDDLKQWKKEDILEHMIPLLEAPDYM